MAWSGGTVVQATAAGTDLICVVSGGGTGKLAGHRTVGRPRLPRLAQAALLLPMLPATAALLALIDCVVCLGRTFICLGHTFICLGRIFIYFVTSWNWIRGSGWAEGGLEWGLWGLWPVGPLACGASDLWGRWPVGPLASWSILAYKLI